LIAYVGAGFSSRPFASPADHPAVAKALRLTGQSCRTAAAVRSTPTHKCRKARAAI